MPLRIERVADEAGARAYHALERSTIAMDHPGLLAEPLDDVLGLLPNPLASFRVAFYLGRVGDDVVASGFLVLPLAENTHTCDVNVLVTLGSRCEGIGTQMARFLLAEARREGRRVARGFVGAPLDAASPGDEMAAALGAIGALGSIRRELRLADVDAGDVGVQLKELRGGRGAAYDLVSWQDTCPGALVDGAAGILPRVLSDSPRGELDMDDAVWDAARYREYELEFRARRRHQLATAAVERATGRLVAFTDLNVPLTDHRQAAQYGTVVVPDHRGRRLGWMVKAANLLHLLDAYRDTESVQTYNAEENVHMVAVNEALGFRPVERMTIWQLTL